MASHLNPVPEALERPDTPHKRLQLHAEVTPEFLHALENELITLVHDRLMAHRERFLSKKLQMVSMRALKYISIFGLCMSIALFALGGFNYHGLRLEIGFIIFFALAFLLARDTRRLMEWRTKLSKPYWLWLARSNASRMLRVAKKSLPFRAEYEFRDNVVVYYRISKTGSKLAWTRTLKHWRVSGQHATLLFKKKTSLYPYILIMHEASHDLSQYLEALGIQSIVGNQDI